MSPNKSYTAVIVDDNYLTLSLLRKQIAKLGVQSTGFCNADQAIQSIKFNVNNIDIIFMDCVMPYKDGFTAVKELREMGINLPIVAYTSLSDDPKTRTRVLNCGMNDMIEKPCPTAKLAKIIKDQIEDKVLCARCA